MQWNFVHQDIEVYAMFELDRVGLVCRPMCRKNKVVSVSHASLWTSFTKIWKQPSICKNSKMLGASDFTFIRCFWILQSFWLIKQFPYFAKWFCVPGVQPVRQRPCFDWFHGPMFFCFAKDSETMLWGLTGTPCLDDFANVAKLVRACSDIDLLVFRRQLDAKDLVTWKNVFGRFAYGVLSHFRWVWEHLGNFCTSFDFICSEATVFCLLCATWSYNHFRRNELWTTWHVPMAIWRVWRHLNSRPFDRFDDVICVICVISKSYHARCKECWFYQEKLPPPKKDTNIDQMKWWKATKMDLKMKIKMKPVKLIVKVQEELVALYHTPAERAIYEGAASSRRGPRSVPW